MAPPDFDPYALLGIAPSATPDEIRAAYRRLAAACHPDIQPPEKRVWASERMIQLNAARDLLLNARRRVQYHREHADHLQWGAEKTRWQTQSAQAAYKRAHRPAGDRPLPRVREQLYALIVFSLAGLVIVGILVLLGLWKTPAAFIQGQRDIWSMAVQQVMIWMAAFGGFLLAAVQVLFLSGILALLLFGLTHWWKR